MPVPPHPSVPAPQSWHLSAPVAPGLEGAVGAFAARRRVSLARLVGDAAAREALLGAPIRPDRIAAAVAGGRVVGCLSYRLSGAGALVPSARRYRATYGPVSGTLRYLATEATLRRGRRDALTIESFAVEEAWRGQGIGTALLAWLGAEVARHGRCAWRAEMRHGSPAAALYRRAGAWPERSVGLGPAGALVGFQRLQIWRWEPVGPI